MSDFAKLMRLADEHTNRVQSNIQQRSKRPAPPTQRVPPTGTPRGLPNRSRPLPDLAEATRIAEEATREFQQIRNAPRPKPKPSAASASQRERAAPSSRAAPRNGSTEPRIPASSAARRPGASSTSSPAPSNLVPARRPAAESLARNTAAVKMSYSELLKHASDKLGPAAQHKPAHAPIPIRDKPKLSNGSLSKPTRPGEPASSARKSNLFMPPKVSSQRPRPAPVDARRSTLPASTRPVASATVPSSYSTAPGRPLARMAPPARTMPTDLIPLSKAKRDRRSIEEVQSDLKRRRTAAAPDRPLSPPPNRRPTPSPIQRRPAPLRDAPPSAIGATLPRPHAKYAGKKPPSSGSSVASKTVPQKRPPTATAASRSYRADADDWDRPRSGTNGVKRPYPDQPSSRRPPHSPVALSRAATTARPRPTVSQKKPPSSAVSRAPAQYGGKRPPTSARPAPSRAPPPRLSYPGQRRPQGRGEVGPAHAYRDDEEEYESDLDSFIVDDEDEGNDVGSVLKDVFGYDRSRYQNYPDDDDIDNMEADARSVRLEEARSARLARQEDQEEEERERLQTEAKRRRKTSQRDA
ncbi:SPT2 chromatin protein-domain-containing protein [Dimargaris cristalligena]|uniref:SPT2 chromatin protein-domain-containing protein n=1 Tax=Dimargaris cristalligena TaxID=215637 RepID=A0A4P9ZZV4_9FUNG|nr:SPT2 chromatin protein-domain-containing protein [Dimargaris cristalligena]|eukprot:RKP39273.1 SPT2 chromatin protein-domain-containing protein [Dimargaris cristalligena]